MFWIEPSTCVLCPGWWFLCSEYPEHSLMQPVSEILRSLSINSVFLSKFWSKTKVVEWFRQLTEEEIKKIYRPVNMSNPANLIGGHRNSHWKQAHFFTSLVREPFFKIVKVSVSKDEVAADTGGEVNQHSFSAKIGGSVCGEPYNY